MTVTRSALNLSGLSSWSSSVARRGRVSCAGGGGLGFLCGSCDTEGVLGGGAGCLPDCACEKAKGKRQKRRGKNMRSAIFFAGKSAAARISILMKPALMKPGLVVGGSRKLPTARLPPGSCNLRSAFWLFIMFDIGRLRDKRRAIPQNLLNQAP